MINNWFSAGKRKKVDQFKNLVAIALGDGELNEKEYYFLCEIGYCLGLKKQDINQILKERETTSFKFVVPVNEDQRIELLENAVIMMMTDGSISDAEYKLCLELAEKLGYDQLKVDALIQEFSGVLEYNGTTVSEIYTTIFDDVYCLMDDLNLNEQQVVRVLQNLKHRKRIIVKYLFSQQHERTIYLFTWLLFVYNSENKERTQLVERYLQRIVDRKATLKQFEEQLIVLEKKNPSTFPVSNIDELSLPQLQEEIFSLRDQ